MAKKVIEYQSDRVTVDEDGVVKEHEHTESVKTTHTVEPPYIKLYIDDILYISDMPKSFTGLTYALLKRASYANKGLRIDMSVHMKHEICAECGYEKLQSLTNALGKLCKGNIIKRLGSGAYQFNPHLFGRGEWKDIDNIRATWDYSAIKGRTFAVAITRKDGTVETPSEPVEPCRDWESEDDRLNAEERADRAEIAV